MQSFTSESSKSDALCNISSTNGPTSAKEFDEWPLLTGFSFVTFLLMDGLKTCSA